MTTKSLTQLAQGPERPLHPLAPPPPTGGARPKKAPPPQSPEETAREVKARSSELRARKEARIAARKEAVQAMVRAQQDRAARRAGELLDAETAPAPAPAKPPTP